MSRLCRRAFLAVVVTLVGCDSPPETLHARWLDHLETTVVEPSEAFPDEVFARLLETDDGVGRPAALGEHVTADGVLPSASQLAIDGVVGSTVRPALRLPRGLRIGFPCEVTRDSVLRLAVGRAPRPEEPGPGLPLALRVGVRRQGRIDWRWRIEAEPNPASSPEWQELEIDLRSPLEERVEVLFELAEGPEDGLMHFLGDPFVTTRRRGAAKPAPNVVLVVVDGLRADRMPWGAYPRRLTPTLEQLAATGWALTAVRTPAPWTRPAVASLFTGASPVHHGVLSEDESAALPPQLPTLADLFRRAGYATAGFSANLHLHWAFGLHRGFSSLQCAVEDGAKLAERALAWLDASPQRPFFLLLFLMDTHHPLQPRSRFDLSSAYAAQLPEVGEIGSRLERRRRGVPDPTPQQVEELVALYDENVRYADQVIRGVLVGLEQRRLRRGTILAVTADHGEAFGEHGDFFHGWNLHEELLRVPLVLSGPGVPAGARTETPVSLSRLAATLLELAGLPTDGVAGDKRPLPRGNGEAALEPVFSHTSFRGEELVACLDFPHKLIVDRRRARVELYDLSRDPRENRDLASQRPQIVAALREAVDRWMANEIRSGETAIHAVPTLPLDTEARSQLRALGYLE